MAARFGIGFDPAWISPTVCARLAAQGKDGRPDPTARVIIPVTKNHYIARAIDPNVTNYTKMNETGGGHIGLFNMAALYSGFDNVFICEGVFDALSIMEAGAPAVAINSTNNADQLIKELEGNPTTATLILAFDNDKAGNTATAKIREGAARLNISYVTANISAGFKDPNEALTGDREKFIDAIAKAQAQTAARPDNVSAYINLLMGDEIKAFKSDISTGFKNLDAKSGGLYPGLYAVGAISSLGKTTFCHQLADQIAAAGHDVLFFSMEQSRLEMVTKSIARIINQEDKTAAVSSLSIRKGYTPPQVLKAAAEYQKRVGERMNIIEGNFRCNIDFISDYTRRYMVKNNCKPVVFIDYWQILRPSAEQEAQSRPTNAKEVIDAAIVELKRMSREQGLTVIVISSVNRNNYMTPIDFESFKESGGIEYTADVVWGLQLAAVNDDLFKGDDKKKVERRERLAQAKDEIPREIELVCLKNRYGRSRYNARFVYYPQYDYFMPAN
jgi:replicative DNA helicase